MHYQIDYKTWNIHRIRSEVLNLRKSCYIES